jgi:hypothetical protein
MYSRAVGLTTVTAVCFRVNAEMGDRCRPSRPSSNSFGPLLMQPWRRPFGFGIRKLKDPRWQPAADSEAFAELVSGQVGEDGQPWGDDVPRTPYAAASLLMTGVLDNLGSIRQLIGDPMPAVGPTLIARSAMEIGATAWWLMEPGIGARRRTCRQLVLSCH